MSAIESETSPAAAASMPPEIRSKIFRYLPVKDLKNCRLTSVQWNEDIKADSVVMKEMWKNVSIGRCCKEVEDGNIEFVRLLMKFGPDQAKKFGCEMFEEILFAARFPSEYSQYVSDERRREVEYLILSTGADGWLDGG